jgi:hypothetical protein
LTGSALLGAGPARGASSTRTALWAAAHVEEDFNIARWGEDAEAAQIRAYKRSEFDAAAVDAGKRVRLEWLQCLVAPFWWLSAKAETKSLRSFLGALAAMV